MMLDNSFDQIFSGLAEKPIASLWGLSECKGRLIKPELELLVKFA